MRIQIGKGAHNSISKAPETKIAKAPGKGRESACADIQLYIGENFRRRWRKHLRRK